jgi:uncharacterized protein involved in exopolysaccharide biosynthesis
VSTPPHRSDTIAFADVYRALLDHRRSLAAFVLAVTALAGAVSFLLPIWYAAGAEFSIETAPSTSQPSGVLGLAAQFGLSTGPGANSINYYADVLTSDQVLDQVALRRLPIDSAGGMAYLYAGSDPNASPRTRDRARRKLHAHLDVAANPRTNTITFSVEGRTPVASRAAADTVLASLNRAIIALRRQRASAERAFLESRVDSALSRQHAIEDTLRQFYVHNRVANTPNLLFTEARLKRDVEFAQTLVSQLRAQLEQARLQEVRDTPALSVISVPEIPGRRSRPNRKLIVLAAFIGSCLLCLSWTVGRLSLRQP